MSVILITQLHTLAEKAISRANEYEVTEHYNAAKQSIDDAIEMFVQIREIGFMTGVADLVSMANDEIELLNTYKDRLSRLQILTALGMQFKMKDIPDRTDMH